MDAEKQVNRPFYILPVIIFSQFAGTSLWFAGNAVVMDLQRDWGLAEQSVGYIIMAVQIGFIGGTLVFAYLAIIDRYSPRWVFFTCSLAGALANLGVLVVPQGLVELLVLRLMTGLFLAGIYPVGMKIAAGWYEQGLGRALGYLVGALVLGTAFPHLIRSIGAELPWQQVLIAVSGLAAFGGLLMLALVPDGPHLPKGAVFNPRLLGIIFRSNNFRASAFGYFGHMWELYALWAFIPVWLVAYSNTNGITLNVPLWTFLVIAVGFLGCVVGGVISAKAGSGRVAVIQLTISGICCLLSPLFLMLPCMCLLFFF